MDLLNDREAQKIWTDQQTKDYLFSSLDALAVEAEKKKQKKVPAKRSFEQQSHMSDKATELMRSLKQFLDRENDEAEDPEFVR